LPRASINPNVPKELDEIVLKALSKNRSKRFENLDQMNRALMKFLYAKYPDFNATDLSYFAQELFREEIKVDREKMFEFGKVDIKPFLEEMKKELERGSNAMDAAAASGTPLGNDDVRGIKREAILDFGFDATDAKKKNTITIKKTGAVPKEKTNAESDSSITQNIADINDKTLTNLKKDAVTRSKVVKEQTRILKVQTKTDIKKSKPENTSLITYVALLVFLAGGAYYFYNSFFAENHIQEVASKTAPEKARQPAQEITPSAAAEGEAKVTLTHFDKQKMQVFIDGQKTEVDMFNSFSAPVGKPFTLRVQIEGAKHFVKEMNLANNSALEEEIPEMPAVLYGYVFTSNDCGAAGELRFEIFGEKRSSPIPMKNEFGVAFPLSVDEKGIMTPSQFELFFKKSGEDIERKIDITIKREDQSIDLCEYL
jgi:serine/threonine-protein kinase